jgi:hypothetical protein
VPLIVIKGYICKNNTVWQCVFYFVLLSPAFLSSKFFFTFYNIIINLVHSLDNKFCLDFIGPTSKSYGQSLTWLEFFVNRLCHI